MYNNKLTEAYYTNCEKIGEQFQLIQVLIQNLLMTSPRCSWEFWRRWDPFYNDRKVHVVHKSIHKKKMQSPMLMIKSSDQTQLIGNARGVLPQSIQSIDQRMHQTFQNPGRSLFERKDSPNMRSIGTGPRLYRLRLANRYSEQSKGIFFRHDNSVHEWDQNAIFFRLHWHPEHSTEKINKLRFRRFGISKFTITYIGSTTTSLYRILALTNIIQAIYGIIYLYENSVV